MLSAGEGVFALAGVRKNRDADAWEFVPPPQHGEAARPPASIMKRRRNLKQRRNVRWGDVTEFLFSRGIGYVSVPNDGGYPLGLGDKVEEFCYPVVPASAPRTNSKGKRASSKVVDHAALDLESIMRPKLEPLSEKERIGILQTSLASQADHSRDVVSHNKEVKSIQKSRELVGCSCRPLKADKLNIGKLREEIMARSSDLHAEQLEKMKKAELTALLKALLIKAPNVCTSADCECVRFEIRCNPRYCHCQCASCVNPQGWDHYDADVVQTYRRRVMALSRKANDLFVSCEALQAN